MATTNSLSRDWPQVEQGFAFVLVPFPVSSRAGWHPKQGRASSVPRAGRTKPVRAVVGHRRICRNGLHGADVAYLPLDHRREDGPLLDAWLCVVPAGSCGSWLRLAWTSCRHHRAPDPYRDRLGRRRRVSALAGADPLARRTTLDRPAGASASAETKDKAAEAPKYGGALEIGTVYVTVSALSWDPADFNWKLNHDTGLFYEQLFAGDLSKARRNGMPSPNTCCWPMTSARVCGRRRSARG